MLVRHSFPCRLVFTFPYQEPVHVKRDATQKVKSNANRQRTITCRVDNNNIQNCENEFKIKGKGERGEGFPFSKLT